MTFKDYQDQRSSLMNEAQALIDEGKLDDYKVKAQEVEDLDAKWDATKEALDNLQALSDEQRAYNVQTLTGVELKDGVAVAHVDFAPVAMNEEETMTASSDIYRAAWAKNMMGQSLTVDEQKAFDMVNSTLTTVTTGQVVPTTFAQQIWDEIEKQYPLWNDVTKTYVNGNYTVPVAGTSSDAAWYDEGTNTADGSETFTQLALVGCELARAITISWKLREMSIADFEAYIQKKLVEKIGAALGYGVARGQGKPGVSDTFKPEPMGIITALLAEDNTPQVITYTSGSLSYANLATLRSKVEVSNGLAIYANAKTIWTELAKVLDSTNRPIMVADPINGGVSRVFGIPVKEDASLLDGQILLSAAGAGYIANVNKDMSLSTEEHVKARTVDYCAYAIVDGGVTSTKCHALLKNS